ncbi:uncharacterized protein LOC129733124 isoform X2 [Wyeomyia smithii]|uniref:uncharacterized protein LOC129733124 isoform X2 n=1 Tax=Wyeomyia smithii TaxID=174621 RepID=UPI002467FE86|nr:uncharacterized protein LOC129733124 isoform X2 [Wyeomyia smithii]
MNRTIQTMIPSNHNLGDEQNVPQADYKLPEANKRSGTTGAMEGFLFESKLLTLVLYRATQKKINPFGMATNMDGIGAFDDLVFIDNSEPRWGLFMQGKHKNSTISHEGLTAKTGDFSLCKYLDSFKKIKTMFKGINVTCVLYHTGSFDKKLNIIEDIDRSLVSNNRSYNLDDLISTQTRGKKFRLSKDNYVENLIETAALPRIQELASKVIEMAFNEKGSLGNGFEDYQFLLAKEVIDVGTKKIKSTFFEKSENIWPAFRETMGKNALSASNSDLEPEKKIELFNEIITTPSAEAISKAIMVELKYNSNSERLELKSKPNQKWDKKLKSQMEEIKKRLETLHVTKKTIDDAYRLAGINHLKSLEFKNLPVHFGKINSDNGDLAELAQQFTKVISSVNCTSVRLSQLQSDIKIARIFELVGSLLILDIENETFKFDLNSDNWITFFETLKQTSQQIDKVRFVNDIDGLTLINKSDRELVEEFLDNLWFYVSQPNEYTLEKELKREIFEEYREFTYKSVNSELRADFILDYVHNQIQRWCIEGDSASGWLTNECQYFEKAKKELIFYPTLTILNGLYNARNQCYKALKFKENIIKLLEMDNFSEGVLNVVTKYPLITSSKINQFFKEQHVCYLINWDVVAEQDCTKDLIEDLKACAHHSETKTPIIIIIIVNTHIADFTLDCSSIKNCILISSSPIKNDVLSTFNDNCNGLADLTSDSQDHILANGSIFYYLIFKM